MPVPASVPTEGTPSPPPPHVCCRYLLVNPGSGLVSNEMSLNGWWGAPWAVWPMLTSNGVVASMATLDLDGDGDDDLLLGMVDAEPKVQTSGHSGALKPRLRP